MTARTNLVPRVSHTRTVCVLEGECANEPFPSPEEIDMAGLADKKVNGYDSRREAAAMRDEVDALRVKGLL